MRLDELAAEALDLVHLAGVVGGAESLGDLLLQAAKTGVGAVKGALEPETTLIKRWAGWLRLGWGGMG